MINSYLLETILTWLLTKIPYASGLTMSTMSSQRKHYILMAKLKREEAEKQENHDIGMRKKKSLKNKCSRWLFKNWRRSVAATNQDEAELMDIRYLFSICFHALAQQPLPSCSRYCLE